jgi:hypothetical protein
MASIYQALSRRYQAREFNIFTPLIGVEPCQLPAFDFLV